VPLYFCNPYLFTQPNFDWKARQVLTGESMRGAYGGRTIRVVETNVIKSIAVDVGYLFADTLVT